MSGAAVIKTTCPYCGVGCGVAVGPGQRVAGDADHPANRGRLCSKGSALGETLGLAGRLLAPRIGTRDVAWDNALAHVAARFADTIKAHGPDSVAFYVSGQLLTEDYYVANKLMKGFIGGANIDTNSRLCMASSVAGHRRAFGEDLVPGCYEDFEGADLVVLVGSNSAWCHPVLHQRLLRAKKKRGTRIVIVDPRRTASTDGADLHLSITPGTDVLLFNGLLVHLARMGALNLDYIAQATAGFEDALTAARHDARDLETVALRCGLSLTALERFYRWFAETPRTVTAYSQGVNQSAQGTDKVNAIINCHLATGRIGQLGAGPFSLTGQPNAMGGREVGGLANQLAAHMSFAHPADIDRVQRFWNAPRMARQPGLKAVDMFEAVGRGRIKAIWIMGTNPAVSLPDAGRVRDALAACPFVVVSDCVAQTDTTGFAHVLLPAAGWGEKEGTVTNSDRTISRQRAFRAPAGLSKPDWWIVTEVARRLGYGAAFAYRHPSDIFCEHAALSAFENDGARLFNLAGLAGLDRKAYDAMSPIQWPVTAKAPRGTKRLCGAGRYPTDDGRARFVTVCHRPPAHLASAARPFILNTGRDRDQWHTMTRTGPVPRLAAHMPEPTLSINPDEAGRHGLEAGWLVRIESDYGQAMARLALSDAVAPGTVFLPMHWNDRYTGDCVTGRLVNPETDPLSGQPELKYTPVSLTALPPGWAGFVLTRTDRLRPAVPYWARCAVEGGFLYELAGPDRAQEMIESWESLLELADQTEIVEYRDARRGILRQAVLRDGVLEACLFAGPDGSLPGRDHMLAALASGAALDEDTRAGLLSSRGTAGGGRGRTVCACFNVGRSAILRAIRDQSITDVAGLGQSLRAGTNCGSCVPELREILAVELRTAAE